jgi:tetratricopeptide (TPR) repeat protein
MVSPPTQVAPPARIEESIFRTPEKRRFVASLLLFLLALIVYNPAAHNEFVSYDDPAYVTGNRHIQAGLSWQTIEWAFSTAHAANWHPLTWLSHALDWQLFAARPLGHHYTSLLLHGTCVVLLFLFLEGATGSAWRSLTVAALFAVHPINVESVAWVSERKNVLCTMFFLLALLAYRAYTRRPSLKRYLLVALWFTLGLLSKPMVITLPFVLLLLDYWPLQRMRVGYAHHVSSPNQDAPSGTGFRRLALEKLPLLALSAASAIITVIAQRSENAIKLQYSLPSRLENAAVSYCLYIGEAVWPAKLAAMYPHPVGLISVWKVALASAFLIAVTIIVRSRPRQRYLLVGWLWFLGTLVPVIGLVQVGDQAMADRYAYIPFIGLFIAAVWGVSDWLRARRISSLVPAIATPLVLAGLAFQTHVQIGYWHDSYSLWSHTLAVTHDNFIAHDNLGAELLDEGKPEEAKAQFEAAARINPRDAFSMIDLGVCEKRLGNSRAAMEDYQSALRVSTDRTLRSTAFANLGSAYRQEGSYDLARQNYEAALVELPDNVLAMAGLGLVAQKTGDIAKAIDLYRKAAEAEPSDTSYFLLAQALHQAGRTAEAGAALSKAQKMSRNWDATQHAVESLLSQQP